MRNTKLLVRVADIALDIIHILFALRFVLKFFGVSVKSAFATWVYTMTQPLLRPIINTFPSPPSEARFTLEFSVLFAMIFYAVIGYLFIAFVQYMEKNIPISDVQRKTPEKRHESEEEESPRHRRVAQEQEQGE